MISKKDMQRPKGKAIKLLHRITLNKVLMFPDAELVVEGCIKKYSSNWHATRKHLFGDKFSCSWMVDAFCKRNSVKVGIYKGFIVIRKKWGKEWMTVEQYFTNARYESLEIFENQCKSNKSLLRKLNEERKKWQRLQQQAN